jgi:sarcosine oxidase, subunit beta
MPVYKDLGSTGMLYCRSYGGRQMVVREGTSGEILSEPNNLQGDNSMDDVAQLDEQVADRFPSA